MFSKADYWEKLKGFKPTVYDAFPENSSIREPFRSRPYSGGELYYKIYSEIAADVRDGASLIDLGAYPGTFLRLCREVFFPGMHLSLFGTGLILEEDEENYRKKAEKCKDISFLQSGQHFAEFFKSLGIPFFEMNLDYCYNSDDGLPDLADKFDIVTSIEVIEHLHTPYRLIALIEKLLKPGGICVLETNNVANIVGILKLLLTRHSNLDFELVQRYEPGRYTTKHPHTRFYSLEELKYLLTKSGVVIENAQSFSWAIPQHIGKFFNWHEALRQFLLRLLPGKQSHIIIKGRKPV